MNSPLILIAYSTGGERIALDLFEHLESMASASLRLYSRLQSVDDDPPFDVALCIVTDSASLEQAHQLQRRLDQVPTLVVDNARKKTIALNGFAGCIRPEPQEITAAVKGLLAMHQRPVASFTKAHETHQKPNLVSRFAVTLARLGGLPQGSETVLAAATRHLMWELRAERAEAYIVDGEGARLVFRGVEKELSVCSVPKSVLRTLAKSGRLVCRTDSSCQKERHLLRFMEARGLNVLAPMMSSGILTGWVGLSLADSLLTSDFLDDLHIAIHFLSQTLSTAAIEPKVETSPWHRVLTAFRVGMLVLDRGGTIIDCAGELNFLGLAPKRGEPFGVIRSAHVREVIAEAMRGTYVTRTWPDAALHCSVTCSARLLPDGKIALCVESSLPKTGSSEFQQATVALTDLWSSLEVPVLTDSNAGLSSELPIGLIRLEDSVRVRNCAQAARSQNATALRVRYSQQKGRGSAVVFFETPSKGSESHLSDDIKQAVHFDIALP